MKTQDEILFGINCMFKTGNVRDVGNISYKILFKALDYESSLDCYYAIEGDYFYDKHEWDNDVRIIDDSQIIPLIKKRVKKIKTFDNTGRSFSTYAKSFPELVCLTWLYDNTFDESIEELYQNSSKHVAIDFVDKVIEKFHFTEDDLRN